MRLLVFAALLLPLAATAQPRDGIDGGDGPLYVGKTASGAECYVYRDALVLDDDDNAGKGRRRIVIKKLDVLSPDALFSVACDNADQFEAIYDETDDFFEFFHGLRSPYLFLDSGTYVGSRGLEIIDLENGRIAYKGSYSSDYSIEMRTPHQILFYLSDSGNYSGPCLDENGEEWEYWGSDEQILFDLETGEMVDTGRVSCSPRS
jgi:hypothetical protein